MSDKKLILKYRRDEDSFTYSVEALGLPLGVPETTSTLEPMLHVYALMVAASPEGTELAYQDTDNMDRPSPWMPKDAEDFRGNPEAVVQRLTNPPEVTVRVGGKRS